MRRLSDLDDRELDLVLAHEPPRADEREELVAFIQDLRGSLEEGLPEATAAAQLAAIVDAARLHAHHEGAALPGRLVPRTTLRRILVRRNPFSSLSGRFAALAALALFLAAFGGIAYAGELPGPVQGSVADLAGVVGLSLDDGDDADVDSGDVDQADLDQADVDDVDEIELPNLQPLEVETDEVETDEAEQDDADVDEADVNEPEDNDADVDEPEDNDADVDEVETNEVETNEVETNEVETNEVEADVDDSESDEPQSGGEQGDSDDDQPEPGTDGDD